MAEQQGARSASHHCGKKQIMLNAFEMSTVGHMSPGQWKPNTDSFPPRDPLPQNIAHGTAYNHAVRPVRCEPFFSEHTIIRILLPSQWPTQSNPGPSSNPSRLESQKKNQPGNAFTWTTAGERALRWTTDLRAFPVLIILFILNFIDRNNFANARLKGLEEDLRLTDVQYQTCISILLVEYIAFQIPSNMLLNTLTKPSWYLCAAAALWGAISAATAGVQNATGAILCRFFLGCAESTLFPGSIYFLSRWYTKREMQLRVTLLNVGNIVAQAFGGLIAADILGRMEGTAGVRAWRWLFILEGAITVASAIIAGFVLPDYPSTTSWLSTEEKQTAQLRLELDLGLKQAVVDPKVWLLGISYHCTIMGLCFSYFFPTSTQFLGYGTTTTLLLTAPPWIWAVLIEQATGSSTT
ncbi:major facilitator superfamily domain-containing protein [Aspergillus nidulans var. acristatus]